MVLAKIELAVDTFNNLMGRRGMGAQWLKQSRSNDNKPVMTTK